MTTARTATLVGSALAVIAGALLGVHLEVHRISVLFRLSLLVSGAFVVTGAVAGWTWLLNGSGAGVMRLLFGGETGARVAYGVSGGALIGLAIAAWL